MLCSATFSNSTVRVFHFADLTNISLLFILPYDLSHFLSSLCQVILVFFIPIPAYLSIRASMKEGVVQVRFPNSALFVG